MVMAALTALKSTNCDLDIMLLCLIVKGRIAVQERTASTGHRIASVRIYETDGVAGCGKPSVNQACSLTVFSRLPYWREHVIKNAPVCKEKQSLPALQL